MITSPAPEQYLSARELKMTLATAVSNLKDQATALRATVDDGATEGALRAVLEKVNLASECLSRNGLDYARHLRTKEADDRARAASQQKTADEVKRKTADEAKAQEAQSRKSTTAAYHTGDYQTQGTAIHKDGDPT